MIALELPRTPDDWRGLALALANLPVGQAPGRAQAEFDQLKDLVWDVASYAAFWHTVQLPSLGPGLLPWVVILIASASSWLNPEAWHHRNPATWPSLGDPFILLPSLWLLGWYLLTELFAVRRHRANQRPAVKLAFDLGLVGNRA